MLVKQLKRKQRNKKGGFLKMLLGKLSATLLASKGVMKGGDGVIRGSERMIKTRQDFYFHLILYLILSNLNILSKGT